METTAFPLVFSNAHYLRYPLERFLRRERQMGKRCFSLYGSVPHLMVDHCTYKEAEALAARLSADGFSVAAWIPAGYGYSLFAEQGTRHREASLNYFRNCVYAARCLHAEVLCLRPENGLVSQSAAVRTAGAVQMLREIAETAEEAGLPVALGTALPSDAAALHTLAELQSVLAAVDSPQLGGLLDTYVMSEAGESVLQWTQALGERLRHVFLSDGRGGGYRVWGAGVCPVAEYRRQLMQAGYRESATCFFSGSLYEEEPEKADAAQREQAARWEAGLQ